MTQQVVWWAWTWWLFTCALFMLLSAMIAVSCNSTCTTLGFVPRRAAKKIFFVFELLILRSINFLQNSLIKQVCNGPWLENSYFNDQFFFRAKDENLIGKIKTKECNLLLIGLLKHTYNEHTERRRRSLHLLIWHASNDNELRHAQIWYSWQFSSKWPTWFFSFIDKISR